MSLPNLVINAQETAKIDALFFFARRAKGKADG